MGLTNSKVMIIALERGRERKSGRSTWGDSIAPVHLFLMLSGSRNLWREWKSAVYQKPELEKLLPHTPRQSLTPHQVEALWMDYQHCLHHPHTEVAGVAVVLVVLVGSRCYQMYPLSLSLMSGLEEPRQSFCYGDCFLFQASRGLKSPVWEGHRLCSTPDYLEIVPQSLSRLLQGDRLKDKKKRLLGWLWHSVGVEKPQLVISVAMTKVGTWLHGGGERSDQTLISVCSKTSGLCTSHALDGWFLMLSNFSFHPKWPPIKFILLSVNCWNAA